MSRFNEYLVPSVYGNESQLTIPQGWYTTLMQEGTCVENQVTAFIHSNSEEGNSFEYYQEATTFNAINVVGVDKVTNGVKVLIDNWK